MKAEIAVWGQVCCLWGAQGQVLAERAGQSQDVAACTAVCATQLMGIIEWHTVRLPCSLCPVCPLGP